MTEAVASIETRFYSPDDYGMVAGWWRKHDWDPIPLAALPKNGLIARNIGVDCAAGWIYLSDSAMCHVEWLVANPEAPARAMAGTMDFLIRQLLGLARFRGARLAFMSLRADARGLIRRVNRAGYDVTESPSMHNMLLDLNSGKGVDSGM